MLPPQQGPVSAVGAVGQLPLSPFPARLWAQSDTGCLGKQSSGIKSLWGSPGDGGALSRAAGARRVCHSEPHVLLGVQPLRPPCAPGRAGFVLLLARLVWGQCQVDEEEGVIGQNRCRHPGAGPASLGAIPLPPAEVELGPNRAGRGELIVLCFIHLLGSMAEMVGLLQSLRLLQSCARVGTAPPAAGFWLAAALRRRRAQGRDRLWCSGVGLLLSFSFLLIKSGLL